MICVNKKRLAVQRSNVRLARSLWGVLPTVALERLKEQTEKYGFSVAAGDLQLIDGRWYVTSAGLLQIAQRRRYAGIRTAVGLDRSRQDLPHDHARSLLAESRSLRSRRGMGGAIRFSEQWWTRAEERQ
jgi:hypothetical protein